MKSNESISRIFFWPNFLQFQFFNWEKLFKTTKNAISRKNFFDQIPFFAISKMAKKSIFELPKSLKLPGMQFHEKIFFDLFDFTSFFAWTFFNFLARYAVG